MRKRSGISRRDLLKGGGAVVAGAALSTRVMADAPRVTEHLCAPCQAHFAEVKRLLHGAGVAFSEDTNLVRGLDYYVRTAFEAVASNLGAQNAVGGGGRYDGLVEALGGPPLAGVGFALGVERLLLAADSAAAVFPPEVCVIPLTEAATLAAFQMARREIPGCFIVSFPALVGEVEYTDASLLFRCHARSLSSTAPLHCS